MRILERLLDEKEFLSPYGIRAVSARHATHKDLGYLPGVGNTHIEYLPGESDSGLFGGNSNWRGPIWMPCNFTLIQALEKFHRYLGNDFKIRVQAAGSAEFTLREIATLISERLVDIFRRDSEGRIPALPADSPFQNDPNWKDLLLFHEYFHADNGQGARRGAPDRLDRPGREPDYAALPQGYSGLLARTDENKPRARGRGGGLMLARTQPYGDGGFFPHWARRAIHLWCHGFDTALRVLGPSLDVYIRAWLAQHFFISGVLKAADWDHALALARYEYLVSWMDPVTASWTGVLIELIAPPLLLLGLATRATAASLMALALVIQFNYQALDLHLLWAAMLGWYVVRGAGSLSLDRILAAGLADSALPLASPLAKAAAWTSCTLEPIYRLLLRVWFAASLLAAGGCWIIPSR